MQRLSEAIPRCFLCLAAILAVAAANRWLIPLNATTVALILLLIVLAAATRWGLPESIFTSVAGMLTFNYFFLPPVGEFTVADPENWVALFAFVVTAATASKLSSIAQRRTREALAGRNEIGRLYELSRALLMEEGDDAVRHSISQAGQILRVGEIAFFDSAANRVYGSVGDSQVSESDLAAVAETGEPVLRGRLSIVPVRLGAHLIGSLATVSERLSQDVRDSVASLLAINYERTHALDRAAAAEVARRNEEFKSSLLDGLAHDLKTPLTAIRTCVTRLITIPPRSDEVRHELLSIIDQESLRLQATITEAIELARIESRELRLEREPVEIGVIVEAAFAEIRDENRARYSVEGPSDLRLFVDPNLVRRALLQVLENARKYSPPDSPIHIVVAAENGACVITVLDRGPGLNPADLVRIFDKFFRGRGSRDKVEGTGMGLAIAKSIIEAHGGRIRAGNRPGGGAEITAVLPLASHE